MDKKDIENVILAQGLTMESVFIPFSQSRNKAEKNRTMNWEITVKRNGRHVLTTEYSAGAAHCPSYNQPVPAWFMGKQSDFNSASSFIETECGLQYGRYMDSVNAAKMTSKKRLQPDFVDVMYSLVSETDVLNHADFESWAGDFGYDIDSRAAESIYKACLSNSLKLSAALGDVGLAALRDAFQDY